MGSCHCLGLSLSLGTTQYNMRSLLILLLGIPHALAKPTAQDGADLSIDNLPSDSSDNALLPPINSSDNEVATCPSKISDDLSNENLENSPDERIISRELQECPDRDPNHQQAQDETPKRLPVIVVPSKPNDRCPSTNPVFVSCGGPEVIVPKRFGFVERFLDRKFEYPVVVNCVEGEPILLSNGI